MISTSYQLGMIYALFDLRLLMKYNIIFVLLKNSYGKNHRNTEAHPHRRAARAGL
jgi:hypothetical protein